jgi:hypothetical protein
VPTEPVTCPCIYELGGLDARCLKRKIASHVWRRMLATELRRQLHVARPEAS